MVWTLLSRAAVSLLQKEGHHWHSSQLSFYSGLSPLFFSFFHRQPSSLSRLLQESFPQILLILLLQMLILKFFALKFQIFLFFLILHISCENILHSTSLSQVMTGIFGANCRKCFGTYNIGSIFHNPSSPRLRRLAIIINQRSGTKLPDYRQCATTPNPVSHRW